MSNVTQSVRLYIGLLLAGMAIALIIGGLSSSLRYPFANDSTGYVEEAGNLLAGNGLVRTPAILAPLDQAPAPSPLFPPGYSLIIALISVFGVDPREAALWSSRFAWAMLPTACVFSLRHALGTWSAVLCGLLAALSPGMYEFGYMALADAPFLLLSILSLGLLLRSFEGRRGIHFLLLSGLLAGIAYTVRNAGTALLAAGVAAFFLAALLQVASPREALKRLGFWSLGALPPIATLAVRNFLTFGSMQPYSTGTSEFGLVDSIRMVLWSNLLDWSGSHAIAQLAWDYKLTLMLGVPVAAILTWAFVGEFRRANREVRFALLTVGVYFVAGTGMVVLGRALYDWVETNLLRYVMQYSWAAMALVLFAVAGRQPFNRSWRGLGTNVLALLLLVGHSLYIYRDLQREAVIRQTFESHDSFTQAVQHLPDQSWVVTNEIKRRIAEDSQLMQFVSQIDSRAMIASNFASVLGIETGRPIRSLPLDNAQSMAALNQLASTAANRPVYCVIFPTNAMLKHGEASTWQNTLLENNLLHFERVYSNANVLIVRYSGG